MDLSNVTDTLSRLESQIDGMRQTEDEKRRRADEIDSENSDLKREMAQQVAEANRIAEENDFVDTTISAVESRYERQLEEQEKMAAEMRDEADQLKRDIAEAENVVNELKKIETNMRDYVQDARAWMDRAREIMG